MRSVIEGATPNPLGAGFYTVRDAARLIEVGNARRIYGWLRGYPSSDVGPLIERDYPPFAKQEELSFLDLMEIRFIEYFREEGVKVTTLRKVLSNARAVFKENKPLATSHVMFHVTKDKKNVIVDEVLKPAAKETGDKILWNLADQQIEFRQFMDGNLAKGVVFNPKNAFAMQWSPRPESFPEILIKPNVAYGQPVTPTHVPTAAIYQSWKAGDDISAIADWYEIPLYHADMAVKFERSLSEVLRPHRPLHH